MNSRLAQIQTLALAVICGGLLLVILTLELGLGRGYRWEPLDATDAALIRQDDLDRSTFKLPPWERFAEINSRPLFNEDRKPTPPAAPGSGKNEPSIPNLNATLSGVIITPKVRMVMITEKGKTQSTTVKEGNALPGDLGAWRLAQVKPRGAVFKNAAGAEMEMELVVASGGQSPAPQNGTTAAQAQPALPAAGPRAGADASKPQSDAERAATALRTRIEARRQQMREQGARTKKQQGGSPASAQQ